MNAIQRLAEIQGHGAERVFEATRHPLRQARISLAHLLRRDPVRPRLLAADSLRTRPAKTFAADRDRIGVRVVVRKDVVELAAACIDNDRINRVIVRKGDHCRSTSSDLRSPASLTYVAAARRVRSGLRIAPLRIPLPRRGLPGADTRAIAPRRPSLSVGGAVSE